MGKYRKTAMVEAIQWAGVNPMELAKHVSNKDEAIEIKIIDLMGRQQVQITTLEGIVTADIGDYVLTGDAGDVWPVRRDIFEATYELVKEEV